jgi:hypothetical protein
MQRIGYYCNAKFPPVLACVVARARERFGMPPTVMVIQEWSLLYVVRLVS